MPSQKASQSYSNKGIKDFFKPFTIPRNRIPINDVVEEEIIVAAPKPQSPTPKLKRRQATASPNKRSKSPGYTMTAVAIPSPTLPPPPAPPTIDQPARAVNTSFSSVSSFSSVPVSTQSSSKRVVKKGMHAVTNSDSGSEDSDSSDDLADPSTFISIKRRKLTPQGQDAEHAIEIPSTVKPSARQSKRLSDKGNQSSTATTASLRRSPPRPVYKHSLMSMAKQKEKQEKADAKVRDMEAAFEEATRRRHAERRLDVDVQGGLKAAVADDSDEGERMMLAMERTEALEAEENFYHFRGPASWITNENCPTDAIVPHHLANMLKASPQARAQAFLTGFVAICVNQGSFDTSFPHWMAAQLLHEPREDLCEAYVETLSALAANSDQPWNNLAQLHTFYGLHDLEERDDRKKYQLRFDGRMPGSGIAPRRLEYVVRVVEAFALKPTESLNTYLSVVPISLLELILANLDDHVRSDANWQLLIHDAIESILRVTPERWFEDLYSRLHRYFFAETAMPWRLRCRAVTSLPARTERSHQIRRLLALHLFGGLTPTTNMRHDVHSFQWGELILYRMQHDKEYTINATTDYRLLAALISVLDIAIDGGFSTYTYISPEKIPAGDLTSPAQIAKTLNAQVDSIASQLKNISSRIRDAGTSHLQRTEAKGVIERLTLRLEHAVRTRPKTKKGVFGGRADAEQTAFMSGFLKQADDRSLINGMNMNKLQFKITNEQQLSDSGSAEAGADDDMSS